MNEKTSSSENTPCETLPDSSDHHKVAPLVVAGYAPFPYAFKNALDTTTTVTKRK